jgi:hypothetical protein
MLTGSLVSSLQGEPRSTHDLDFVVVLDRESAGAFTREMEKTGCHLDEDSVLQAIDSAGTFNLIDPRHGMKVDFWLLTDDPFDRSRLARRARERVLGMDLWVTSPEDTILAKLRWSKLSGGSRKQETDALRVYEVQYAVLDSEYLERWVVIMDLGSEWQRLLEEARPIDA